MQENAKFVIIKSNEVVKQIRVFHFRLGVYFSNKKGGIVCSITKIYLMFSLIFYSTCTMAEQCWQVSGCDNIVGWLRVNKYNFQGEGKNAFEQSSNALFGTKVLPLVNSQVKIRRLAKLRYIDWSDSKNIKCHDYEYSKNEIPEVCSIDDAQYDYVGSTAVVRILSYHKGLHLFALVQIISYPKNPFKVENELPKQQDDNNI